jgi:AmmeMemoRadiSam system protein A
VTLKEDGELRGCIGDFYSEGPLSETVREMAEEAAVRDSRFHPVTRDELGRIKVEVSVLSPLTRVASINDIQVGKHGLYIMKDGCAGVLLPQVPVEYGWDREAFLSETCQKAGLPQDAWQHGATLEAFSAEIFRDLANSAFRHKTA